MSNIDNTVEHPKHYNQHPSGIECIDIVEQLNFNFGCAVKYLWRCGKKSNVDESEDIRKAKFYLDRELKRLRKVTRQYSEQDMLNSFSAYKMSCSIVDLENMIEKVISSDKDSLLSKVLKSIINNENPLIHFT